MFLWLPWERLWGIRLLARETGPDKPGKASDTMPDRVWGQPPFWRAWLYCLESICEELKMMQLPSFLHHVIIPVALALFGIYFGLGLQCVCTVFLLKATRSTKKKKIPRKRQMTLRFISWGPRTSCWLWKCDISLAAGYFTFRLLAGKQPTGAVLIGQPRVTTSTDGLVLTPSLMNVVKIVTQRAASCWWQFSEYVEC